VKIVFVDTGYWIALLNPYDELHTKVQELSKLLNPVHLVTSEMVLTEVLNDFSKRGEHLRRAASKLVKSLYEHPNVTIIHQTSTQFQEGLLLYEQRQDKAWSHTDCVSFQVMQERCIIEALAYDKHFEQAGFTALLRNCQGRFRASS
jgi:predicted nucleic acid-binding protein